MYHILIRSCEYFTDLFMCIWNISCAGKIFQWGFIESKLIEMVSGQILLIFNILSQNLMNHWIKVLIGWLILISESVCSCFSQKRRAGKTQVGVFHKARESQEGFVFSVRNVVNFDLFWEVVGFVKIFRVYIFSNFLVL